MARIRPGVRDVARLANPRTTHSQVAGNPAPTIVLLFGALVALQLARAWRDTGSLGTIGLPELAKDAVLLGLFLLAASFAPELVAWFLLVALIYVVVANPGLVNAIFQGLTRAIPAIGG